MDLCRLAGLKQCGLCCEIMRDDGTMMRTTELLEKAAEWGLKVISIKELQDYCRLHDKHMFCEASAKLPTRYGEFQIRGYVSDLTGEHHVALVKGDIGDGKNILCRVHSECLTGDVFGSCRCDCGLTEIPAFIAQSFDQPLLFDDNGGRRYYVTLGQFSLVRLERDTQLLIPVYDYCIPQTECSGGDQEDPCGLFRSVAFPVNEFFPPNTVEMPKDYASTRSYCACH